ncbi:hypothetical protein Spirs_0905 [Sediminispirochaeta smaragdinae DSM 11293]|uniref:Uncharacterized protein n=2 Tax=Sediminispirochaeta TaxID=1911556 RepID=E1RCF9_SEDSS|nr:hypothetical protein Spirs_0905 [Sediminispirochaeta smaragdinae DSM 11293]
MNNRVYTVAECVSIVMRTPRRFVLLFFFLFFATFSVVGNEIDRFWIVEEDDNSSGDVKQLVDPLFRPGETFKTLIVVNDLRIRQGKGSVSWNFKYYINGHLSHMTDTESYSGFQEGIDWHFRRERFFTIAPSALRGKHRIEIFLKDNNSGKIYHGAVHFEVGGKPITETTPPMASGGSREAVEPSRFEPTILIDDISIRLSAVDVRNGHLVCTFLVSTELAGQWLGFSDALLVDSEGGRHEAIVGGTIRGDGGGGLDLVRGIPIKGEVFFDSWAAGLGHFALLEVHFDGDRTGRWRDISNPYGT